MNRDDILETLRSSGLDRLIEFVEPRLLPAIRLAAERVDEDILPLGASKIGGHPDVPPEFSWPIWQGEPLSFLAQVHLCDLAGFDLDHVLPANGMLYFFYDAERQPWGYEVKDESAWQVLLHDGPDSELRHMAWPDALAVTSRYAAYTPTFSLVWTVPARDVLMKACQLTESERDKYIELDIAANDLGHQLLGHPMTIQHSMEPDCELVSSGRDTQPFYEEHSGDAVHAELWAMALRSWRLLFQVDTILSEHKTADGRFFEMEWGLGGQIYFWIEREALARRDFSNVRLILQTT